MPVQGRKAVDRALELIARTITSPPLLEAAARSGTLLILNRMKELAPVKTGDYRRGLHMETILKQQGKVQVAAGTNDERGPWIEFGTEPHEIRAKARRAAKAGGNTKVGRRALRFTIGGQVVFAKVVHHPGTKPRPHMRPAFEQKSSAAAAEAKETLKAALRVMAKKGVK